MTKTRISTQDTDHGSDQRGFSFVRSAGIVWLAVWVLISGGFAYRALTRESASEAVAAAGNAAADSRLGRDPAVLKPIEQINVGERVAFAINPTEAFDNSLGTAIHPHAWRKIELRPDAHSRVVLLRPEWWVNERIQADSRTMAISIPEVGIHGDARIVSITPCPRIPAGEGRVVIGTFAHLAPETIRLTIQGIGEPIRCTPNHATWSVEARHFIEAQDLQPGQHVLCRDGIYKVASIEHLAEPIEVFNLEIFGQHVYQVTTGGMLVHNAGAGGSASNSTPKPRTTKVQPVEGAGSHTGFKRSPQTGEITGHTTFDENGFITQRTDITGRSHGGVPTPHTHVHGPPNVAPDGRVFPGVEIEVRPALPSEIPKPQGN